MFLVYFNIHRSRTAGVSKLNRASSLKFQETQILMPPQLAQKQSRTMLSTMLLLVTFHTLQVGPLPFVCTDRSYFRSSQVYKMITNRIKCPSPAALEVYHWNAPKLSSNPPSPLRCMSTRKLIATTCCIPQDGRILRTGSCQFDVLPRWCRASLNELGADSV